MSKLDEEWARRLSSQGRESAETAARTKSPLNLVGLVNAWIASVKRIGNEYGEDYYDDYYTFVSWREAIDDVLSALGEADASVIRSAVEPADVRFKNVTIDDGGRAMSEKFTIKAERWYWRRVPTNGPIARSLGTEIRAQ
jgi:hypothetical protein